MDIDQKLDEVEEIGSEKLEEGREVYRGEKEGSLKELLSEYAEEFDIDAIPEYEVEEWEDFVQEYNQITRNIYEMILND